MEQISDLLKKKFEEMPKARAKHEFQEYGIWLSDQLKDKKHKPLYIKLSKEKPRSLLQKAMVFAIDYNTNSINRGRLFMWKLAELEKNLKAKKNGKD